MKYILEKISDDVFGGNHPNGYNVGFIAKGSLPLGLPMFGKPFIFSRDNYKGFATTIVTEEMNSEGIFKTLNSTYKLIEYRED